MNRFLSSIIFCSLLLLCACGSVADDLNEGHDDTLLVNLNISVALSDISDALAHASRGDADPKNDNERMNTLRIVIVRPDGTVEANEYIDLTSSPTMQSGIKRFTVVAKEEKSIYLFVNENTEVFNTTTGTSRKLLDYDLSKIKVKGKFPNAKDWQIHLEENSEQITGALPMSQIHKYYVTKDKEQSRKFFVTRAAVKFSIHIINESSNKISFGGFTLDKMAREEWYFPRASYNPPAITDDKMPVVSEYEVPAGVGYYSYIRNSASDAFEIEGKKHLYLEPIYLLEGKYIDEDDSRNYSMNITINNITRKHYFPELSVLPRNTHVVVHITCNMDSEISCIAEVIPYSEIFLDPEFGI